MPPRTKKARRNSEVQRAIFVGTLLTTHFDLAAAQRASGLKDPHACDKIGKLLLETHSLADRPRSGRPPKYDDNCNAAAYQQLITSPTPYHTDSAFAADLQRQGKAPPHSKGRCLKRCLRKHLASKGKKLAYGQRSRPHSLVLLQEQKRRLWCTGSKARFDTEAKLQRCTFEDETTVEEDPHPKGKSQESACQHAGSHALSEKVLATACGGGVGCPRMQTSCSMREAVRHNG